jgi:formylglycine-generating enzyme required for sulfatase activity
MALVPTYRPAGLSGRERRHRRRYLSITLLTCLVLVMIGSTIHVVMLGALRLRDMRKLATYDLTEESARERAAGEDITLQENHEAGRTATSGYSVTEAQRLLGREQWEQLDGMVRVPAGPFVMGTDLERADAQDKPQHKVSLPAFYLDKYLVTNAQYARFVVAANRRPPIDWKGGRVPQGELLNPVTMVTWSDAAAYCGWAGKRLPHEAEFEKAGRGTDGRRWPWGDKMDPSRLNTYYNVGSSTNVTAYPQGASVYGAYDLAGNVAEWMADDLLPYEGANVPRDQLRGKVAAAADAADAADQPAGPAAEQPQSRYYKVLRGGSWKSDPFSTSLYHRDSAFGNHAADFLGFRCASDSAKSVRAQ